MTGWSERVRQIADDEYVKVARGRGGEVPIRLGDLKAKAKKHGFPSGHAEQIATAIESEKFWKPRGLRMISPKGQSRQVDTLFRFEFVDAPPDSGSAAAHHANAGSRQDPLLALAGTLKHAFAEGAEAFIREMRRDKEPKF